MQKFGIIPNEEERVLSSDFCKPDIVYAATMDRDALWDPETIEKILKSFPLENISESDLFLILAECIANAVLHGQAEALGFYVRKRGPILLLTFRQIPVMQARINAVLEMARKGELRECTEEHPGGLGFPILIRIVRRITVNSRLTKIHLWMRTIPR